MISNTDNNDTTASTTDIDIDNNYDYDKYYY